MRPFHTLAALVLANACWAVPINVALSSNGGVASESSVFVFGDASKCNDGNTDGNYFPAASPVFNSICHTDVNADHFVRTPWWQVTFRRRLLHRQHRNLQPDRTAPTPYGTV